MQSAIYEVVLVGSVAVPVPSENRDRRRALGAAWALAGSAYVFALAWLVAGPSQPGVCNQDERSYANEAAIIGAVATVALAFLIPIASRDWGWRSGLGTVVVLVVGMFLIAAAYFLATFVICF
jgi:hypothetical protein